MRASKKESRQEASGASLSQDCLRNSVVVMV